MNILWDLRLFSYKYASRGVGRYTEECAKLLLPRIESHQLFVWGDKKKVPNSLQPARAQWIDYQEGSWKKDLLLVPLLARKHHIDLFHYWVSLGPIFRVGMGAFVGCSAVGTVYDLGVELWHGVPYLDHIRSTWYWRMQKVLASRLDRTICISATTEQALVQKLPALNRKTHVLYPPPPPRNETKKQREPYFVALGGARNKNLLRILDSFELVQKDHPEWFLVVLGETESAVPEDVPWLKRDSMENYHNHLCSCSGLVFCSTHEGLGLPPIEAMSFSCPLLLSNIASLKEIATDAGRFVDPGSCEDVRDGMLDLIENQITWKEKSRIGYDAYVQISQKSSDNLAYPGTTSRGAET